MLKSGDEEAEMESDSETDESDTESIQSVVRQEEEDMTVRAQMLVMMGEVSSGRRALDAEPSVCTAGRRSRTIRSDSGTLKAHSGQCTTSLCQAAELLARASIPEEVLREIRIGRMTALQKPTEGVRGIVAGDIIRRLVSRTIAQQIRTKVEKATAPFQYALSTRAGCECIAHAIQAMTDANPRCTVLSVDGIGAYDISRRAMLSGLVRHMEGGDSVLPFVLQFYGSPSSYLWEDSEGVVHEVLQGEGGEQGDALMPALFSLGQHDALVAIQGRLAQDERLVVFLDDIYAGGDRPERSGAAYTAIQEEFTDPHRHRGAPGEDTTVESSWSCTGRQCSINSSCTSGRSFRHCVAWGSSPPS